MIERLAGAVVAIAAAALLVAGVVTPAWWAGQTTAGGAQDVTIGLRSEQVCHLEHTASGKPRCTATTTVDCDASANRSCRSRGTLDHGAVFGAAGWGATIFGALAALLLAIAGAGAMSRGQDAARGAANAGGVVAVLGAVSAGVFVLLRPGGGLEGAIGWPAYAYLGGAGAGVLASLILRREPAVRPVHRRAPAGPVKAPRGMEFDVGALFGEDEVSMKAPPAAAPPVFAAEERTDVNAAPPAAMVAARVPSENRADTEKDLPPDDMQGTPAPKPAPPPPAPPPAPPPRTPFDSRPAAARSGPPSLPPLPLPRTKPPSLPPPFKPPTIPSGTGASPRVAPPDTRPPPPPPAKAIAASAGPVPACPQCDSPTMWNEEHLRFYCRKCRIYL